MDSPGFHGSESSENASPRILVIRGGALGDFILTLPVLAALRHYFPRSHIEVMGYPQIAQLAQSGRLANQIRSLESPELAVFFVSGGDLNAGFAHYFAGFGLILSFLHDPGQTFENNVRRCTAARFVAGPHRPDESRKTHATEVLLEPLRQLGLQHLDPVPRLDLDFRTHASHPPGRWLALHPGSGSLSKNWPEPRWAEFLERLVETTGMNLLLVGGEAEGDRLHRLSRGLPAGRIQLAQGLPLPDLAHRLKACCGYVGHDTGITHLAAALGLAGLVLWGPSEVSIWRPRSDLMNILRHRGGLNKLPVNGVMKQVQRMFLAIDSGGD